MKKALAVLIAALMICSFAACSGNNSDTSGSSTAASQTEASQTDSASDTGTSSDSSTSSSEADSDDASQASAASAVSGETVSAEYTPNTNGKLETTDLFSKRDLLQTPDLSGAKTITASDNKTETITEEGTYIISGTASNFTVRVEADSNAKVQLVLDGLSVTNDSTPVIYVVSADKCFVTTNGNESTLSVTGKFETDGDTNTDAVIFAKDDLVLNGTGTLNITSSQGNGIAAKDDLKITGGTYKITSGGDSIEVKDSLSICGGTFGINSSKDGIQCKNSDDESKGSVLIAGGTFTITAANDAIQAATVCQIDGGTFNITGAEGIEATYVQINDGELTISASDDGINAGQKTNYSTPTVEFNGGTTKITMGQGDTDAVDANGDIYVNGGTIDITATVSSFDYDGNAEYNGGTIIINGSQVDSIPQSMMGGGGMGGRMDNMNR